MFGNKMIQSQIFCKAFATIRHSNSHEAVRYGRNSLILCTKTDVPTAAILELEPASTPRDQKIDGAFRRNMEE